MSLNLIDPITPGTSSTTTTTAKNAGGKLGKQDFLNMLVAQLQNQDPLNPVEGTDYTAQLAQFSSLEQLMDMNTSIKALTDKQSSLGNLEALSFVGRRVKASGDYLNLGASGNAEGRYSLADTAKVSVAIYDSAGKLVRNLGSTVQAAGEYALSWDGLNSSGTRCAEGSYTFKVTATGMDGNAVEAKTYSLGTVSGVRLGGTEPNLILGTGAAESEIPLSDLTEIFN